MRLGGDVGRRVDGHVMSVRFRHGNDFGDENIRLLTPFTKLEMLNLQGTQIAGTRIELVPASMSSISSRTSNTLNLRNT